MKVFYGLCLVSMIFISCNKSESNNKVEYITIQVKDLAKKLDKCYERVIILPGSGCSGCITSAEDFFKNNSSNPDYLFVLTNINSLKILKNKTGVDVYNNKNIVIDKDNKFSNYESAIYPVVVFHDCANNKVEQVEFQSPENDAFSKI